MLNLGVRLHYCTLLLIVFFVQGGEIVGAGGTVTALVNAGGQRVARYSKFTNRGQAT